jgi:hypothetical protein
MDPLPHCRFQCRRVEFRRSGRRNPRVELLTVRRDGRLDSAQRPPCLGEFIRTTVDVRRFCGGHARE